MTIEDIVKEYISILKNEINQFNEMDINLDNITNSINDFKIDNIDLYNLNPESKVLFVITNGDPLITLKIAISNLYQNKKIVLFISGNLIELNSLLINKFTNVKIEYNLKGEFYLETHDSYDKYFSIQDKFDEIILIGDKDRYLKLTNEFKDIKYIGA